jgi:hypothetical protein
MVITAVIPVLERLRQRDCKFETSLAYIVSLRQAWATQGDPVSKRKKKEKKCC